MERKYIILKHLLIEDQKCIGLQYYADKILDALVKQLPGAQWSSQFRMSYVRNTAPNLDRIYKQFRGVAWINSNYFFSKSSFGRDNPVIDVQWLDS